MDRTSHRHEHKKITEDEQMKFNKMMEDRRTKQEKERTKFNSFIANHCRHGNPRNYHKWLDLHKGEPTHNYDYDTPTTNIFIAQKSGKLPPAHGAKSIMLIVPSDIIIDTSDIGHNNVYFMKNGENIGHFVPFYNDC